uniref:S-adenosyl-L-methionine-dependent methyltransferase superfamily protein n=1 Tax=Kalanchoe fedtschenkoi TaxID=63787 RepID=A0A7N0TMD4_KALFE
MGRGRKPRHARSRNFHDDDESYEAGHADEVSAVNDLPPPEEVEEEEEEVDVEEKGGDDPIEDFPSKFSLYQQSVQSPKGDISYLLKFFLLYVGGRVPLHFQEDFCGTALLSTEWIRNDTRRTAIGLDLDLEALEWSMENNISKVGSDGYSRLSLFHGNVLQPGESMLLKCQLQELMGNVKFESLEDDDAKSDSVDSSVQFHPITVTGEKLRKRNVQLPARDIICAFNYSCCCLHKHGELVTYFRHVIEALSKKGGIFVMDLYGGTSSECGLKLQRKFSNFTYVWEQEEFDIVHRKTRISLHFHLKKQQKKIRHAFSYSWRLWSLPEVKDCMEEAGFQSVHFWMRQMPDTEMSRTTEGFGVGRDLKYEEVSKFEQQDAWNAYIVGVAK